MIIRLLLLLLVSISACAEDKLLRIAFAEVDSYPYEYVEDGELKGMHVEVIQAMAQKFGYKIQTIRLPWKRILRMMEEGQVDAASYIGGFKDSHDMTWFHDNNSLSANAFFLMTLKERKDIRFRGDLNDLKGLTLGAIRGYQFNDATQPVPYSVIEVDTRQQLVELLKRKRIDAAVVMRTERILQHKGLLQEFRIINRPIISFYTHLGFSKKNFNQDFVIEFAKQMEIFWEDPEYSKILDKYTQIIRSKDF